MTCPHCSCPIQVQRDPFGNPFPVVAGTLNLCGQCGGVCTLEDGQLVAVSVERLNEALENPSFRQVYRAVQIGIRKARHLRG